MKLLLLIAALVACDLAHAECIHYKPDGTSEKCPPPVPYDIEPAENQAGATSCQLGGMVAYKAYLEGTYDAQRPDIDRLKYLVDYWSDMMVLDHNRTIAFKAVGHIAQRMQASGMRQPYEGAVYEAAREFIATECK